MVIDNEQDELSPNEKMGEAQSQKIITEFKKEIKPLYDYIKGVLRTVKLELGAHKISYEEVLKYCIAHKDDSPDIVKGALIKETSGKDTIITQVFLDKENKIVTGEFGRPMGYKKKVTKMDDELLHLFKDDDLIIIE